jgi:hypothetical protein
MTEDRESSNKESEEAFMARSNQYQGSVIFAAALPPGPPGTVSRRPGAGHPAPRRPGLRSVIRPPIPDP